MREVWRDLIENKKSKSPVATTQTYRTSVDDMSKNNLDANACGRNREKSESEMDIFTSGMLPNVAGFKREIGHRCVSPAYFINVII